MPRRLQPTGEYPGPIWGDLPPAFPTDQAQRVYRCLLEQLPDAPPRALMGQGFKGVAYRFRATTEYKTGFESLLRSSGPAPPVDDHYRQEKELFGFFVSGLACLECFAFALHAIAASYRPSDFGLGSKDLYKISPEAVARALQRSWPTSLATAVVGRLVAEDAYRKWKAVRNVLGHRAVPPRLITIESGASVKSTWQLVHYQFLDDDETLDTVTGSRLEWLERRVRDLWDGVEQSFPPP